MEQEFRSHRLHSVYISKQIKLNRLLPDCAKPLQNQNQNKNTDQKLNEGCDTGYNLEMLHSGARSHHTKANPSFFCLFCFSEIGTSRSFKRIGER